MEENKIGEALGDAFKNLIENKFSILKIFLFNILLTIGIIFLIIIPFLVPAFAKLLANGASAFIGQDMIEHFSAAAIIGYIFIFIGLMIYQSILGLIYIKLFANTKLKQGLTFSQVIKFALSKVGHAILASILLAFVFGIFVVVMIALTSVLGFTIVFILSIALGVTSVYLSFVLQSIIIDETTAIGAISNSVNFVKGIFWKVVGLLFITSIITSTFSNAITRAMAELGEIGFIIGMVFSFLTSVYTFAVMTDFYCQSVKPNEPEKTLEERIEDVYDFEDRYEVE